MSRKKRYRRLRTKAIKDNLRLFAQNKAKHQAELEADAARQELNWAALIYDTFKTTLGSEARTPPQIISDFEAFREAIRKKVKHKHNLKVIMELLDFQLFKFLVKFGPKNDEELKRWKEIAKQTDTSASVSAMLRDIQPPEDHSRN